MKFKSLLKILLALLIASCSSPPETTAANRQEAMDSYQSEVAKAMNQIDSERDLHNNYLRIPERRPDWATKA